MVPGVPVPAIWAHAAATKHRHAIKVHNPIRFMIHLLLSLDLSHWASARGSTLRAPPARIVATAQNLAHRATKLLLLKRYKDLDYAGSLLQGLKGFAHNRTEHAAAVCSLHCMAWSGRGHKKVASHDRSVFGRDFARHDSDDGERNFVVW